MYIKANKSELREALIPTLSAVSGKSTTPALECVFLNADENNNTLVISGYDLSKGVKTTIDVAVLQSGGVLVNAQKLVAIVNNMPEGEIIISTDERMLTTISCQMSKFEIHGFSSDCFPTLPELSGEKSFEIKQGLLKKMCRQVMFSVAQNDNKPALMGVLFEINDGIMKMISCDGYRLSIRKEKINMISEEKSLVFNVPGKTLGELVKLLGDGEEKIKIEVARRHIIFYIGKVTFFSRLIDGEFIDYERSIPKNIAISAQMKISEAVSGIERVSLLIDERAKSPIKFIVDGDSIKIKCTTANGKSEDEITAEITGEKIEMGFNYRYLLDALRGAAQSDDDDAIFEISSAFVGMIIRPVSHDEYFYMVLPVRLNQ